jgi:hypothetical protein
LNHWRFQARAKMFEISVICIVVLAAGYWVTLWLMGRHEDVLHGDFIHTEPGAEGAVPPPFSSPFPVKPPFPAKPTAANPSGVKPSGVAPAAINAAAAKPGATNPHAAKPAAAETLSKSAVPSSLPADRSDTLQALLASIKRDLKDASQL